MSGSAFTIALLAIAGMGWYTYGWVAAWLILLGAVCGVGIVMSYVHREIKKKEARRVARRNA